jgi:hypothetical protein
MTRRKRSGEPKPGFEDWPPWLCINDEHRRRMKEKVIARRDEQEPMEQYISREQIRRQLDQIAKMESDHSDMEEPDCFIIAWRIKTAILDNDVRETFALFSKMYKQLPEPQQKMIERIASNKAKSGPKRDEALEWGLREVHEIWQIWREVYDRSKREKDNGPFAEEIAVDRWNRMRETFPNLPPLDPQQLKNYRER